MTWCVIFNNHWHHASSFLDFAIELLKLSTKYSLNILSSSHPYLASKTVQLRLSHKMHCPSMVASAAAALKGWANRVIVILLTRATADQ